MTHSEFMICFSWCRVRWQATRKRIEKEWQANDLCEGARDEKRENAGGGGDDDDAVFLRTYANGMKVEVEEI